MKMLFALLAGICFATASHLGDWLWAIVPGIAFFSTAFVMGRHKHHHSPITESEPKETPPFLDQDEHFSTSNLAFDHKSRMQFWEDADASLNQSLDELLQLCLYHFKNSHVAYIYFKSATENTFELRRVQTRTDDLFAQVNPAAQIHTQDAHIYGAILKRQSSYLLSGDLSSLTNLPHYISPTDMKSCLAVPILLDDQLKGLLCVDALEAEAFKPECVQFLATLANNMAQLAFLGYQGVNDRLLGLTAQTLLDFQRQLLQCDSTQEIQRHLARAIDRHLPYDRLLFIIPDPDRPGEGRVLLASGIDAEGYQDMHMRLDRNGLLNTVFQNGNFLHRKFKPGDYMYRLSPDEPCSIEMSCMLAIPVLSKEGKVEIVVSIESYQELDYTASQRELFRDMALATGYALIKATDLESQKKLANQDGLTKLTNHRHFHELHQKLHQISKQENRSYALLFCGIDAFKNVNEKYGHATGDEVLQAVATRLYGLMDVEKLVLARYGGDIFAILLPDCGEKWAIHLGQEICVTIAGTQIPLQPNVTKQGDNFVRVTISVGCAVFQPRDPQSRSELIQQANHALQAAKRDYDTHRGSQVVVYR